MAKGREKLQPWLEKKLNSGIVPGVEWINKEEGTFRILWKRNTTIRGDEKDFQIFKDWAIHTSRFKEGGNPQYPYWKTLFRNALNKQSNIRENKEMYSYKGNDNPYRVFQIKDFKCQIHPEEYMPNMDLDYSPHNNQVPTLLNEFNEVPMEEEEMEVSSIKPLPENTPAYFSVTVKIGSQLESEEKISSSCLIKTGNYEDDPMKPADILHLHLNSLSQHPRGQQIISGLERGIHIYLDKEMNIIANRSCQCRIFYITQNENQESNNLERNKPVKIFDFNAFLEHLKRKLGGLTQITPQSDIFMSVGQRCKPNINLFDDILLSITITSHKAELYLKQHNLKKYNSILMSEADSIDRNQFEINKIEAELLKNN